MTDVYARRLRLPWQQGESDEGLLDTVVWVPNYGSVVVAKGKESEVFEEGSRALPSPAASAPDKAAQKVPPYSSDELDLLALHFTMVKVSKVLCVCVCVCVCVWMRVHVCVCVCVCLHGVCVCVPCRNM